MSDSPIVDVANAVEKTIANPSIPILVEDLLLVHKIVTDVKAQLAGKHPSLNLIFHTLFNLPE